jgi:uroporphyrinogen decarboxylase
MTSGPSVVSGAERVSNHRFLRALWRQPIDRTPVWMMRQAGRYLPEYRATRERAGNFMTLCKTPELACEVTLQPLARFKLDAAILFSDILTVPDAMGLGLQVLEGKGPVFDRTVRTAAEVARLGVPDPEKELRYVMDAVRTIKSALSGSVPLIGFAGSPWTLATYMVEGQGGHDFERVKALAYQEPETMDALLQKLSAAVGLYLESQIRAGADAVMLFDTWGGVLSPAAFERFSLGPMSHIVRHLAASSPQTPIILFTKNGGQHLEAMADTGATALGLDWTTDLGAARRRVGDRVALQGNLDPCILLTNPDRIRGEVQSVLRSYGKGTGHVFNLGHGILPQVPPANAAAMIEAVHEFSPAHHG